MQAGYQIEDRSVADPANRAALEALGLTFVPVVQIGERVILGFPEDVLRRELGMPPTNVSPDRALKRVNSALRTLRLVARFTNEIPDELWELQLVTQRDRPLGMWIWHIFRFGEEVIDAGRERAIRPDDLRALAERRYWKHLDEFRTFAAIGGYGREAIDRITLWRDSELDSVSGVELTESPWGVITMVDLLDHFDRHSAVHLRQILALFESRGIEIAGLPSADELKSIPRFESLVDD